MRILLVQPQYGEDFDYDTIEQHIMNIVNYDNQQIDLIVFPEAFIYSEERVQDYWEIVESFSDLANSPVLVGFSTGQGTEEAYYYNPFPDPGDTEWRLYIKHSTAQTVYFEQEYDEDIEAQMYKPILYKGKKIQVTICHDMFYPLLIEKLEREGMDVFMNLTSGNVRMSKWRNILRGRSIELQGPALCTMGDNPNLRQPSNRIAYINGQKLKPNFTKEIDGHEYSIFDLVEPVHILEEVTLYSDKQYNFYTVGLGRGDFEISLENQLVSSNLEVIEEFESSVRCRLDDDILHVHVATIDALSDRTFVYSEPSVEGDYELYIYITDEEVDFEKVLALCKLRVIENRIAAVVATPSFMFGAKTNRYKDVQLFKGDYIGFDLPFTKGVESVYEKALHSKKGLNIQYKQQYEGLMK